MNLGEQCIADEQRASYHEDMTNFSYSQEAYLRQHIAYLNHEYLVTRAEYSNLLCYITLAVLFLKIILSKLQKKPEVEKVTAPNVMCAELYHPVLPNGIGNTTVTFCSCGRSLSLNSKKELKERMEREERLDKDIKEWKQNQLEIKDCLAKHRDFVQRTIREALKRSSTSGITPLSLPLSTSSTPSTSSSPSPSPTPTPPSSESTPSPLSTTPRSTPRSPLSISSTSLLPSNSKQTKKRSKKHQTTPKRPTLNKRNENISITPPSSPTSSTSEKFTKFEKSEKSEIFEKIEKLTNKENVKRVLKFDGEPAEMRDRPRQPSPPKALAPRSNWEHTRAPSLSPRKKLTTPVQEFRTYSPTIQPRNAPAKPKWLGPGDLACFVLQPDISRIQDIKKGLDELNAHMDKLEKVGGISSLLKCGRLCALCSITETNVRSRLRHLFEKNFREALPNIKTEIQQAMENIDRIHPRSVRGRSKSATWVVSPLSTTDASLRIKPVLTPITPISVFSPKPINPDKNTTNPPTSPHTPASAPASPTSS